MNSFPVRNARKIERALFNSGVVRATYFSDTIALVCAPPTTLAEAQATFEKILAEIGLPGVVTVTPLLEALATV